MDALLLLVGGVAAMAASGWLRLENTNDETSIKLDKKQIKKDVKKAVKKGQDVLERTEEKLDDKTGDGQPTKTDQETQRAKTSNTPEGDEPFDAP